MKIGGAYTVPVPPQVAYAKLQDPVILAKCMPGCDHLDKVGENTAYTFTVTNTGNVTIAHPTVTVLSFSGTGTLSAITCPFQIARTAFLPMSRLQPWPGGPDRKSPPPPASPPPASPPPASPPAKIGHYGPAGDSDPAQGGGA